MMQMAFMLFLNYTILILSKQSPYSQQRLEKRRRDLTKFINTIAAFSLRRTFNELQRV
uniref:ORF22a n=1 Tax=Bombyx mori nuclear polyhedrosis virus TaxID=271108 RepID=A0A8F4XB37_NPVBM|nr:ORF22a [Bombyx mori nucleopolyhedrovirus]